MTKERDKEQISDILILWEQYKKANWYESDAIDVEKYLMNIFVDSFLATLPEDKEEKQLCEQCGKPVELLYCEKCYDRNSL